MDASRLEERSSVRRDARRRWAACALAIIGLGAALRLTIALRAGVGYDEVFVIGLGLDELDGGFARWLVEVPVRRSDAVTPLWWWVQALPAILVGHVTLWGIRLAPIVLGCLGLVAFWIVARRRIGRGPALIALFLAAMCDVAAFASARGEFAEPLLMLAALPAVGLVGDSRRPVSKGALWFVLLFTHLGKGALIVGGLALAEVLFVLLRSIGRRAIGDQHRSRWSGLAIASALALVPTLLWLFFVNQRAFGAGPIETDTGPRSSIWQAIAAITFGYAQTKSHMIGGAWDALQIYCDGSVWPVTTILAMPMIVGILAAVGHAAARGAGTRRGALALSLVPMLVVGAGLVVARGMIGSRFHLLYLPAGWVIAGIGLWRLRRANLFTKGVLGLLWAAHVAFCFSWLSWLDRTVAFSLMTAVSALIPLAVVFACGVRMMRVAGAMCIVMLATATVLAGPVRWGPAARFEPLAEKPTDETETLLALIDQSRSGLGPYPAAHGRTLHIDLANYYLIRSGASPVDYDFAIRHSLLAAQYDDDKARAWVYVGLALQRAGRPKSEVRAAWERSYAIRPEPRVAGMLEQLGN